MGIGFILILCGALFLHSCGIAKNKNDKKDADDFVVKQIGVKNQYPVSPDRFKALIKIDNCQSLTVNAKSIKEFKTQTDGSKTAEAVISEQDVLNYKTSLKLKVKMMFKSKDKQRFANGVIDGLSYTPAALVKHKNQPEVKMTYEQYRAKILTESKKQEAASFLQQNL